MNTPNWSKESRPHKHQARYETIIAPCEGIFGWKELPPHKQYWTMCGKSHIGGAPLSGSEIDQMLNEKFIRNSQFHGVDIVEEYIEGNQQAFPDANWYQNDFFRSLQEAANTTEFNPGVVNADFIHMANSAVKYIPGVMYLLNQVEGGVLLVVNMMVESSMGVTSQRVDESSVWNMLISEPNLDSIWRQGKWQRYPEYATYKDTIKMCTLLLYRQ